MSVASFTQAKDCAYLQYACPLSPTIHTVHLCSKAVEVISASRAARGEIKALVVSIQGQKTEAHEKITSAITRHIQETRAEKVCVYVYINPDWPCILGNRHGLKVIIHSLWFVKHC